MLNKYTLQLIMVLLVLISPGYGQDIRKMAVEIDVIIAQKLKTLKQRPRQKIDDYTYARRLYLNAIGRIPTFAELDKFIKDKSHQKRAKLISTLLSSKGYNSHMYNYWADLLRVKSIGDELNSAGNFSEAIKSAIRENKAYDFFCQRSGRRQGSSL